MDFQSKRILIVISLNKGHLSVIPFCIDNGLWLTVYGQDGSREAAEANNVVAFRTLAELYPEVSSQEHTRQRENLVCGMV